MRALRWIAWGLGGLLLIALLAVVAVLTLVDPNQFKPQIAAEVRRATGRELRIDGTLGVAWFPWFAVTVREGSLANPPSYPGPALASWRELRLGSRLIPLLRGRIELDRVRIEGLQLSLRTDSAGWSNWEGIGPESADAQDGGAWTLAGLDVVDGRVEFVDETGPTRATLERLQLRTGAWQSGSTAPVDLQLRFDLLSAGLAARDSELTLQARLATGRLDLQRIMLVTHLQTTEGKVAAPGIGVAATPDAGIPLQLDMPVLGLDIASGAWRAATARVRIADTANLQLADLAIDTPLGGANQYRVNLQLAPTSLRKLFTALGRTPPATRDPQALGMFAASARAAVDEQGLRVSPLTLQLDDTRLNGEIVRSAGPTSVLQFALRGDQLALARYLEPEGTVSAPFKFPGVALAELQARGTVAFERVTIDAAEFRGVTFSLLLDARGLRSEPAAAKPAATGTSRP